MEKQELKAQVIENINAYYAARSKVIGNLIEVLNAINEPIEFNWESGEAPCIDSISFGDDTADSYITKIWVNDCGDIRVNLHAYYLCEDEEDIMLAEECNAEYADILEYVLPYLDEENA